MLCHIQFCLPSILKEKQKRGRNQTTARRDTRGHCTVKRKVHDNEDKWGLSSGDDKDVQVQIAVIVSNI